MRQDFPMLEASLEEFYKGLDYCRSILSSEDSPVRMLAWQVYALVLSAVTGKLPEADSGLKCAGSLAKLGPDGLLLKTYAGCSQSLIFPDESGAALELYSGTWPNWGLMLDGAAMGLRISEEYIGGKESRLWPTPMASDGIAWTKTAKTDCQYSICKTIEGGHTRRGSYLFQFAGLSIIQCADFNETMMGFPPDGQT